MLERAMLSKGQVPDPELPINWFNNIIGIIYRILIIKSPIIL